MPLPWIAVYAHPRLVQLLLLALAAALVLSRRDLRDAVASVFDPRALRWLLLLGAAGALLRWLVPPGHRIWDEFSQLNSAQNFHRLGAYGETLIGGTPDFDLIGTPRHWPPMFAVLASAVFTVAGYGETRTFALNLFLGSLTVPLLAVGAGLLLDDARAGLAAGALLAVFPAHIEHSAAGSTTIASAFFIAAAIAATGAAARRPDSRRLSWLAALTLAAAVQCRVENALLIPACFLARRRRPSWGEASFLAAALLPVAVLLKVNGVDEADNYPGLAAVIRNLGLYARANAGCLVTRAPGLWLAALASPAVVRRERRALFALAAAAPLYFLLYSAHSSGGFAAVDGDRLSLNLQVLAFVAAGATVASGRLGVAGAVAAALALSAPSWRGRGLRPAPDPELAAKIAWATEAAAALPPGSHIITHSPPLIAAVARHPVAASRLIVEGSPAFEALRSRPGARLYLFEDFWWAQRPGDSGAVLAALDRNYSRDLEMTRRIGEIDYPVYRLTPRSAPR